MSDAISAIRGVFDTINPFSLNNIVIYFVWLVVYTLTVMAIWRSDRRWVRLVCLILNQFFSIGIVVSYTVTLVLAVTYWKASLAVFLVTAVLGWWMFRERRRPADMGELTSENDDGPVYR